MPWDVEARIIGFPVSNPPLLPCSDTQHLKQTPIQDRHVALGAKMVPFAGFNMPVQYTGIIDEHHAVRNRAGLFDVSHMGEVRVTGDRAFGLRSEAYI